MKIIHKELKKGLIKLRAEDLDDLWHLSEIIEPSDLISGRTERKLKLGGEEGRQDAVRKQVFLEIKAEKVELAESQLRVLGTITQGPEDISMGSYHSFTITEGTEITITKAEWPAYLLERLKESCKEKRKFLILVFDRESAVFALTKKNNYEILTEMEGNVEKKRMAQKSENFFKKIAKALEDYDKRHKPDRIIIASPAFWNEYLTVELSDEIKEKMTLSSCSSATKNAIDEVLKRPELAQTLKDERASFELKIVDSLKEALAKEKAVYSFNDVEKAVEYGSVKELFVTTSLMKSFREKGRFSELEAVMRSAEKMQGLVHIISSPDASKQLDALGGIAAIQRFAVS